MDLTEPDADDDIVEEEIDKDDESKNDDDDIDLFGNKRRLSQRTEMLRRISLGLPDNGSGMTKKYYNINRVMSVTSLVDLIVMRRTGNIDKNRRSSKLSKELEDKIKKTLAWKEIEDELNKEDIMVNFRKKMRERRREARQNIQMKENKIERKINEERRIHLRTSLLEPQGHQKIKSTTESIKDAIQEFRMRQPGIIEDEKPEKVKFFDEEKEVDDLLVKTKDLLEKMGYLKHEHEKVNEISISKQSLDKNQKSTDLLQDNISQRKQSSLHLSRTSSITSKKYSPSKSSSKNQQLWRKSPKSWTTPSSISSAGPSSRNSNVPTRSSLQSARSSIAQNRLKGLPKNKELWTNEDQLHAHKHASHSPRTSNVQPSRHSSNQPIKPASSSKIKSQSPLTNQSSKGTRKLSGQIPTIIDSENPVSKGLVQETPKTHTLRPSLVKIPKSK